VALYRTRDVAAGKCWGSQGSCCMWGARTEQHRWGLLGVGGGLAGVWLLGKCVYGW
jgi:hypothetical protein